MRKDYIIYLNQLSQETNLTIDKKKRDEIASLVLKYISYGNILFTLIKPVLILLTILTVLGILIFIKGTSILMMVLYTFLSITVAILLGMPRGMINVANAFYDDVLKILSLLFGITREIVINIRSLTLKRIPKLTDIIKFVLYGYILPSLERAIHNKLFFMKEKIYDFTEMIIGKITDTIIYTVKKFPTVEEVFDIGPYLGGYSTVIKSEIRQNLDKSAVFVEDKVTDNIKEAIDKNLNTIDQSEGVKKIDSAVFNFQNKIEIILNDLIRKKLEVISTLESEIKNIIEKVFLPIFKIMKTIKWILTIIPAVLSIVFVTLLFAL